MSGLTESSISRFLSGERLPGYQVILNIANGLDIDPGLLFRNHNSISNKSNMKYAAVFKYGVVVPGESCEHSGYMSFNFHISENIIDGDISPLVNYNDISHKLIFVKSGSIGFKMNNEKYKDIIAGNICEISGNEQSAFISAGTSFTYSVFCNKSSRLTEFREFLFGKLFK